MSAGEVRGEGKGSMRGIRWGTRIADAGTSRTWVPPPVGKGVATRGASGVSLLQYATCAGGTRVLTVGGIRET